MDIVRRALEAPIKQIAGNSAVEEAIVVDKVIKSKDLNFGFNADTLDYGDLIKGGVVNPTKVIRCALENAASVSSLLLTAGAISAEIPQSRPVSTPGGGATGEEM